MQFVQLGKETNLPRKSTSFSFPSHPAVLPLLTHLGLGVRPPSCFFGKEGGFRVSRVAWQNSGDEEEVTDWGQGDRQEDTGERPQGQGSWFWCPYKSVCNRVRRWTVRRKKGPRQERLQAQASVNELCWPQPQPQSCGPFLPTERLQKVAWVEMDGKDRQSLEEPAKFWG